MWKCDKCGNVEMWEMWEMWGCGRCGKCGDVGMREKRFEPVKNSFLTGKITLKTVKET
jgi:hypothetical protein